ncbi:hypothetical protein CTheo_1806 [Ceratobasidium theobromae]|uniref:Protein kinase regulator n=1 Tax=Ceratobasidium theobromae TaxID=1582974 RepID=A0A5N5QUE1_9AGAM|nr:hypothetical protein CTheo_1806 [Ceratobasidium theobromae]
MADLSRRSRESISVWTEEDVQDWMADLGYPQYEEQIKKHRISGNILSLMDHEHLKDMGIRSVGQRLAILKAVYQLKVAHEIPIEPDAYIPPSEVVEEIPNEGITIQKLWIMMGEQSERIRRLESENQRLHDTMQVCMEELATVSRAHLQVGEVSLRKQPSFRWAPQGRPAQSPTRPTPDPVHESPRQSPRLPEADPTTPSHRQPKLQPSIGELSLASSTTLYERPQGLTRNASSQSITANISNPNGGRDSKPSSRDGEQNPYKSFKVTLDDPCWKVLPAALKKYRISDDWQNYAMFICYGNTDRCLSYDEKPLLLFQKLKDANKNPVFTLRHIKDIRSPIAVAQQKQASRSAARRESPDISGARRPALNDQSASSPNIPAYTRNTRLHQPTVLQPISARAAAATAAAANWSEPNGQSNGVDNDRPRTGNESSVVPPEGREGVIYATTKSYAIAIYPYMAELDDEFDVSVHDAFIIIGRAKGWWIVQRDPAGTGMMDEGAKHSWVPAGCLLETSIPPALAVSDAVGRPISDYGATDFRPIMPIHLTSTSFSGIALRTYHVKGDEELDLLKDEYVRVFKRYNHWSYAVKESNGERGWVPSWYIGKVSSASPATPNTSALMTAVTNGNHNAFDPIPEPAHDRLHANGHHASPLTSPAFATTAAGRA